MQRCQASRGAKHSAMSRDRNLAKTVCVSVGKILGFLGSFYNVCELNLICCRIKFKYCSCENLKRKLRVQDGAGEPGAKNPRRDPEAST